MTKRIEPDLYKWRFAIGTTSRVPNSKLHYLIVDVDGPLQPVMENILNERCLVPENIFIQQTKHGWHIYTDYAMLWIDLVLILHRIGADKKWVDIGIDRGYLFLADKSQVILPWPVERMILHAKRKK